MKINRIWFKFLASYVVVILVVLLAWGTTSAVFIRKHLYKETAQQLLINADQFKEELANKKFMPANQQYWESLGKRFHGDLYVMDINGRCMHSSVANNFNIRLTKQVLAELRHGQEVDWVWEKSPSQETVIALATPLNYLHKFNGVLVLAAPEKGVESAMVALRRQLFKGGLVALMLGALLSLVVSYGMTKQIQKVAIGVQYFAREDLTYRIPIVTHDELGEIAENFNNMAEQIAISNRRRQALLAGVSHEVRTPLTNICGYIEALQDNVVPEDQREKTLALVHDEALFMKKMTNDLIDLARMSSEGYSLNKAPLNLSQSIERVIKRLEPLAAQKSNTIISNVEQDIFIFADPTRIEQLLYNLLKNALQFTDTGEVTISCQGAADGAEICVKDNGIGIEKDQIPFIYDSFYKAEPSRSKEYEESGLGLSICQAIIKLHRGNIDIKSALGEGTQVTVTLPAS